MNIKKYFYISQEEFISRERNIFIPICLGNKFFFNKDVPSENIKKYLGWALMHTKEKVLFVVVDKIQDTNFFVRNKRRTEQASLRYVLKQGEIIKNEIEKIIHRLSQQDQKRVEVIVWEDYEQEDPFWHQTLELAYAQFKNKKKFKESILDAVKKSVTDRVFTIEEYLKLCEYVLDEFSIVYSGVTYQGVLYSVYPYPETDAVLELIEKIKENAIFHDIHTKLPFIKTGVVILK
ncbi:MAG: hypothetical protein HGA33_02410 [Candidatus Moranbacteria bacterium]|nr:hypothetical protein [Candidatus Moranbacteria bacterium]